MKNEREKCLKKWCITLGTNLVNSGYELICRLRNKNNDFTILCSNCIGGIIYSRLGLKFNSPTVNLWIRQYDFIKLALNPQLYLAKELVFISTEYSYPVALLGDIKIHFNHSVTETEARNDWERRKQRICWDNMFFIMYDRDDLSREQILSLQECSNLIILSEYNHYPDLKYVYPIRRTNKGRENEQVFLDFDRWGLRTFEKQWDFVKWLNRK